MLGNSFVTVGCISLAMAQFLCGGRSPIRKLLSSALKAASWATPTCDTEKHDKAAGCFERALGILPSSTFSQLWHRQ